ncbi:uncharacterized protein LOC111379401 [Olea europaea var. sylvestris]|uniref:uncharacterized protein LOC111379401 n=1 Tax=Olea europaea var. sylvestris TaxID=158386 RepID=UPI000C1D12B7|nr:uncharacterized protein LOC111379401 [Olea europaea var. sylvestris]
MEGAANYQMSYVQPASELIQEKDRDILVLNLPGFKKELLKAELTSESRILKISGARQLEDKRWIGFDKDFPVSPNCDTQKISARFDNSKLFVTMPKLISPAAKEEGKLQPLETRKPQKPTKKPFAAPDVNMPKLISQPLETRKPQKPTKKPFAAPDVNMPKLISQPLETRKPQKPTKKPFAAPDVNMPKLISQPLETRKPQKPTKKPFAAPDVTMPKLISPEEKEDSKLQPLKTRKPQQPTEKPFDAPEKNVEQASQKKSARQKMNIVLSVLLAILIGLYVSNLVWYFKKAEN